MTIDDYCRSILPQMNGWCSAEKARMLFNRCVESQSHLCVEVGVFAGRSLIPMALAVKSNGGGLVLGVDPWKHEESIMGFDDENKKWWAMCDHEMIYQECQKWINLTELEEYIHLVRRTSSEQADRWSETCALARMFFSKVPFTSNGICIDVLHIDGNHSEESATRDVELWTRFVKPNGLIFFDDVDWDTTKKAQALLAGKCVFDGNVGQCGCYRMTGK